MYNFSLTEDQEIRAKELHKQAIIINGTSYMTFTDDYMKNVRDAGITLTIPTIAWIENLSDTIDIIAKWYDKIKRNSEVALQATTVSDIKQAKSENKCAYLFEFQNTHPFEGRVDLLDVFHQLGVYMIQPTYNEKNLIGNGCGERTDEGLSNFGYRFIERMNDLNMIIDLSHVGIQTSKDILEIGKIVICSHTNARALCDNVRNKYDEQLKAIAEKDGIIGINAVSAFINYSKVMNGEHVTIDEMLDHLDYICNLVGPNHVAIGLDYSGGERDSFGIYNYLPDSGWVWREDIFGPYPSPSSETDKAFHYPEGIEDISNMINITRGLVARGYSDEDILKILGQNWIRMLERSLKP